MTSSKSIHFLEKESLSVENWNLLLPNQKCLINFDKSNVSWIYIFQFTRILIIHISLSSFTTSTLIFSVNVLFGKNWWNQLETPIDWLIVNIGIPWNHKFPTHKIEIPIRYASFSCSKTLHFHFALNRVFQMILLCQGQFFSNSYASISSGKQNLLGKLNLIGFFSS